MSERKREKGRCWAALRLQSSRQTQRKTNMAGAPHASCLMPHASCLTSISHAWPAPSPMRTTPEPVCGESTTERQTVKPVKPVKPVSEAVQSSSRVAEWQRRVG
jgi:hypothetical protein